MSFLLVKVEKGDTDETNTGYTANVTHDYQSCVIISCSPVVFSGNISCIIYSYLPYYDCFWYFLALSAVAITIISCTLPAVVTMTTIQSYRSCTRDVYICSVLTFLYRFYRIIFHFEFCTSAANTRYLLLLLKHKPKNGK